MNKRIAHIDLESVNKTFYKSFLKSFKTLYQKGSFSGGEYVEKFEKEFAEYLSITNCAAVNSGTSAIHLALLALGIGPGDEVIVPAYTFAGSVWGVIYCGATPVFVDVKLETGIIDSIEVEKRITKKTKAIIVVHLFGQSAPMQEFQKLKKKHHLYIIEDAAQAQGQIYLGKHVGTIGDIGCFSFYPTKNLGGIGEGGAISTNNKLWAKKIKLLRNHHSPKRFEYTDIGFNYRMDGIQALFLSLKLKHLDSMNEKRGKIAEIYLKNMDQNQLIPLCRKSEDSVWYAFVFRTLHRNKIQQILNTNQIEYQVYYPKILSKTPAFKKFVLKSETFSNAVLLAKTTVSLPIYPTLKKNDIVRIVNLLSEF